MADATSTAAAPISEPSSAPGGVRLLVDAVALCWRAGRGEFVLLALLEGAVGAVIAVQLLLGREALQAFGAAGGRTDQIAAALPALAAILALGALSGLARTWLRERHEVLAEIVARAANFRLMEAACRADLLDFERPEFLDLVQRASAYGSARSFQVVMAITALISGSVSAVTLLAALAGVEPLLLPPVLLIWAPLLAVAARNNAAYYKFMRGLTEQERLRQHFVYAASSREMAGEVRAFALGPFLRERYVHLTEGIIAALRRNLRERVRRSLLGELASLVAAVAAVALVGWLYAEGRMDVPSAAIALAALVQLRNTLEGVGVHAALLHEAALFLRDFGELTRRAQAQTAPAAGVRSAPPVRSVELRGVSFTYPGSSRPALRDIELDVRRGEVVALVGENGSGKTTLAKVAAGLYPPGAGAVLYDGVATGDGAPPGVRARIAILFQDFGRYLLTAAENIAIGDVDRFCDQDAVRAAARRAGADEVVAGLPGGYDASLARPLEGGNELSVGQWQRIALARAFFRDASLVILDEPTAALDPRAEHELFGRVRELFEERAVVIVSHRFSTVREADRIYVLCDGRIVEAGDHGALLACGGLYAELFELQASSYELSPERAAS